MTSLDTSSGLTASPPMNPSKDEVSIGGPGNAVLEAVASMTDIPPTLTLLTRETYQRMMWKNGLGETEEIAIFPKGIDFHKDEFVWRLSVTEVHDACTFSVYPGYDIAMMMLPQPQADPSSAPQQRNASFPAVRNTYGAPAILRHNDQESPIPFRPLVPYTYAGELPTTCYVKSGSTRHLNFMANRAATQVTVSLETICPHGLSDDGICDGEGDVSTPVPSPHFNHRAGLSSSTPAAQTAAASSEIGSTATPRPTRASDGLNVNKPVVRGPSPNRHHPNVLPTTKILLGAFTIVHVVSGSIRASVNNDPKTIKVSAGETLICERDEESAPADFTMSPVMSNSSDSLVAGNLKGHQDATIYIIQIHMKPSVKTRQDSLSGFGSARGSLAFYGPASESTFNLASPAVPLPASSFGESAAEPQFRGRKGSIIIYDDAENKPSHSIGQPGSNAVSENHQSRYGGHGVKYWESARHYRPPTFSARYQNESDVPPAVVRDSLVIEEFPKGKISTVWINMVKQGLCEWVRVPVIVARGAQDGPVLGITAVVHGNELNGVPCIHRVITDINVHKLNGTVVAVPCVNVPGYLRFTREFSDGKDLNRLFPGSETGTASQIYAHAILNKIVTHFDYLIDLHTASFGRVNSYYVRADLNDPVSAALAKLQQPQIILHNSGQDGTMRSACSARGIKAITVEIGNPQLFQNQYVHWSYMGVMRILTYLGMFPPLEAEPPISNDDDVWMDPEILATRVANASMGKELLLDHFFQNLTPLYAVFLVEKNGGDKPILYHQPPNTIICSKGFWIYTKTGGVLEVYPAVNTVIRKGDLIARIKNIFGNIVDEIFSPSSGVTIGRSSNPVAMAGDRVLHLGVIKKENEVLQREAKENY
ncbi:hypothetical protein BJ741DRAFT_61547 [Chytriomyces cf. hyalinus JEL632]|nr:hypothetical protein BJ741DRAFT_61547 [Chytriomyces cf. hyalinus JEL632]